MDAQELMTLKCIAKRGDPLEVASSELGGELDVSPQTASRYLSNLEDGGYIDRTHLPRGQRIEITEEGRGRLRREYEDYRRIFEDVQAFIFRGEITSGMGEGRYYMSREGYQEQFEEKLGYRAHPGTLNVELFDDSQDPSTVLPEDQVIRIEGFEDDEENRTFGGVDCFRAEIEGIDGAIIAPERSHYGPNVIEVISEPKLRDELGLEDGDEVEVKVTC